MHFFSSVYKIKEIHAAQLDADGDAPVVGTAHFRTLHTYGKKSIFIFETLRVFVGLFVCVFLIDFNKIKMLNYNCFRVRLFAIDILFLL